MYLTDFNSLSYLVLFGTLEFHQELAVLVDLNLIPGIVHVRLPVVAASTGSLLLVGPFSDKLFLELVRVSNLLQGEWQAGVHPEGEVEGGSLLVLGNHQGVAARCVVGYHSLEIKYL